MKGSVKMILRYRDIRSLKTIQERYGYLRLGGQVGASTFGFDRYLNQAFYKSREWQQARSAVILRDNGCDLGIEGYEIGKGLVVHHMNPITQDDILNRKDEIFDPEFLICVSDRTHKAIHYGDAGLLPKEPVQRRAGDTCPWR